MMVRNDDFMIKKMSNDISMKNLKSPDQLGSQLGTLSNKDGGPLIKDFSMRSIVSSNRGTGVLGKRNQSVIHKT